MKLYDKFPEPVGSFTVGRTQIDFRYKASDNSERELTAFFYYPSDDSGGRPAAEYAFSQIHALRNEMLEKIGGAKEQPFADDFKTSCYEGLALSKLESSYPVLIYNHGAGMFPQHGTMICQDLASTGYIVVSAGHPGSGAQKFSDGRILGMSKEFINSLAEYSREVLTLYMQTPQMLMGKLQHEEALAISRKVTGAPEALKFGHYAAAQSEDVRFIADCLNKMNAGDMESIFKGRLRLEIGIGVLGHSFGGTTAAIACRDDARFVCGVNFDGNMLGCLDSDLKKPFLQLCTALAYNTNAFLLETNTADTYFAVIDNIQHYQFSDSLFTNRDENLAPAREAMQVRDIIITYTKAFFDRYLLKCAAEIEGFSYDGVEMIIKPGKSQTASM